MSVPTGRTPGQGIELPEVFVAHAASPGTVYEMPAAEIAANRDAWISEWTDLVVR